MADNTPNPNREKMIELRGQGLTYSSIAKLTGVSRARVHQICSNYKSPSSSQSYQNIHNSILVRDNFRCQWGKVCKDKQIEIGDLVVHHIDFDDENNSSNNLITLCKFCHGGFHATNHIDEKIKKNIMKPNPPVEKKCALCGKKYYIKHCKSSRNKFCSKKCHGISSRKYGSKREKNRIRHNAWYQRHKNDIYRKLKNREHNKIQYYKDPEKSRSASRKSYQKMMSDPVKRQRYLERQRRYYYEKRSKLKRLT